MDADKLRIHERPPLSNARMLLGFSGWMDGGEVSTGTIRCLIDKLGARKFAEIDPEPFYIYSFPGSMETAALFRPHAKIESGLVRSFEPPKNYFYYDQQNNLVLFIGKEPNLHWRDFADCIFSLCNQFEVKMLYFIGSVAGLVPHTRDPRLLCSLSDADLIETFRNYGVKFTNYEGPASFVTALTVWAEEHQLKMVNLVATIPAYVQGNNPKCIEVVTRRVAGMLGIHIDLDDLRELSDEFERRLTEVVQEQPELAGSIRKLEEDYDNEIFNSEMGDLKKWLLEKGIRLD